MYLSLRSTLHATNRLVRTLGLAGGEQSGKDLLASLRGKKGRGPSQIEALEERKPFMTRILEILEGKVTEISSETVAMLNDDGTRAYLLAEALRRDSLGRRAVKRVVINIGQWEKGIGTNFGAVEAFADVFYQCCVEEGIEMVVEDKGFNDDMEQFKSSSTDVVKALFAPQLKTLEVRQWTFSTLPRGLFQHACRVLVKLDVEECNLTGEFPARMYLAPPTPTSIL